VTYRLMWSHTEGLQAGSRSRLVSVRSLRWVHSVVVFTHSLSVPK
jgi:hypothetical protein